MMPTLCDNQLWFDWKIILTFQKLTSTKICDGIPEVVATALQNEV